MKLFKIKQLEWKYDVSNRGYICRPVDPIWVDHLDGEMINFTFCGKQYPSLEEAKAAAQSQYESLLMRDLEEVSMQTPNSK